MPQQLKFFDKNGFCINTKNLVVKVGLELRAKNPVMFSTNAEFMDSTSILFLYYLSPWYKL